MKSFKVFISAVGVLCGCIVSQSFASVIFEEQFNQLDAGVWVRENVDGAQWNYSSNYGGTITATSHTNFTNQYTDILSYKNDFADFIFSWKYMITNSGPYNDRRLVYFRSAQGSPSPSGYVVYIGADTPEAPQNWVAIHRLDPSLVGMSASAAVTWQFNTWYNFELEASGYDFRLKVWQDGLEKPDTWLVEVTDTAAMYSEGSIGFGNFMHAGTYVDNILVETIETPIPEPASCFLTAVSIIAVGLKKLKK
ncbi:MAG: DUF1080 domain-containing protein [Candidatus Auribacter fodinae]|jgi:hypothetical protein|uniref:DUF1080 domain-containing protein n=1 Tax=Candidatus Auribacter fodinae TaxID=2093366 RepID=A0A3A4RK93_9BACT|nr:MAG: DUF1080 domain-containing protein [Candidatus Auribacter fodinae]